MLTFAVIHKAVGKLLVGGKNSLLVSVYTRSVPKVMRMIFLCSAEGPGKESGGRGRTGYTV